MKGILTILMTLLGSLCLAQQQVSLGIGTNGLGISYEKSVHPKFSMGTTASFLHIKGSTINYVLDNWIKSNYQTSSLQMEAYVKWLPLSSSKRFYTKGGLVMKFNPSYMANSTFWNKTMIGSFELNPDQVGYVNIDIRTNRIQPMLSTGYSIVDKKKFFINTEAGVYFHGSPQVIMEATGTLHLNTVNQQAIQDKIYKYKYFPVLRIETGLKF